MKLTVLSCALLLLLAGVNAIPTVAPSILVKDCGNGIYCAYNQTCMSNATGAGLVYACSPLTSAVRCTDARFSCPVSYTCIEYNRCVSSSGDNIIDVVVNIDAFQVADARDFGLGIRPTSLSICGPITRNFRLPNFCTCRDGGGSELSCVVGLQTYITIGATMWFRPCASPANFGYRAWASLLGINLAIGNTWTTTFSIRRPIPGASFQIGRSNVGATAEVSGEISRFTLSSRVAIGVCAELNVGPFSREICNPSVINWLPVVILNGPRFDFSRFC